MINLIHTVNWVINLNVLIQITFPWSPLWCSSLTGWCFMWTRSVSTPICWSTQSSFLSSSPTPYASCGTCTLFTSANVLLTVAASPPSRCKICKWTHRRSASPTLSHTRTWSSWTPQETLRSMGVPSPCPLRKEMRSCCKTSGLNSSRNPRYWSQSCSVRTSAPGFLTPFFSNIYLFKYL